MYKFDFLVLGSGIAGLSFALKAAPLGRVAIITKKDRAESNTNYAQGGIAAVTSKEDSVELHVQDTLQAGAGLCKESVVRTIVQEGPARIPSEWRLRKDVQSLTGLWDLCNLLPLTWLWKQPFAVG